MLDLRVIEDLQSRRLPSLVHVTYAETLDLAGSRRALLDLLVEGQAETHPGLLLDATGADVELTMNEVWTLTHDLGAAAQGFDGRLALLGRWHAGFDCLQFLQACIAHTELGLEAKAFIEMDAAVAWLWKGGAAAHAGDDS